MCVVLVSSITGGNSQEAAVLKKPITLEQRSEIEDERNRAEYLDIWRTWGLLSRNDQLFSSVVELTPRLSVLLR